MYEPAPPRVADGPDRLTRRQPPPDPRAGIIAVLIAILMPALRKVRIAAINTVCASRLHQIAAACHIYLVDQKKFPQNYVNDSYSFVYPHDQQSRTMDQLSSYLTKFLEIVDTTPVNDFPAVLQCPFAEMSDSDSRKVVGNGNTYWYTGYAYYAGLDENPNWVSKVPPATYYHYSAGPIVSPYASCVPPQSFEQNRRTSAVVLQRGHFAEAAAARGSARQAARGAVGRRHGLSTAARTTPSVRSSAWTRRSSSSPARRARRCRRGRATTSGSIMSTRATAPRACSWRSSRWRAAQVADRRRRLERAAFVRSLLDRRPRARPAFRAVPPGYAVTTLRAPRAHSGERDGRRFAFGVGPVECSAMHSDTAGLLGQACDRAARLVRDLERHQAQLWDVNSAALDADGLEQGRMAVDAASAAARRTLESLIATRAGALSAPPPSKALP